MSLAWLYRLGDPAPEGLFTPAHSLIDQSLHSQLGAEATNGDGFGVGWFDHADVPGVFRSIEPAWNDRNLQELAGHISSGHFFAHSRAAIGSPVARRRGIEHPFQGTIATTDGERTWAFRYSSEGKSRSLFFTSDVPTLRAMYPEQGVLREVSDEARLIVSEPIGNLPGAWNPVPESSFGVVAPGEAELGSFKPRPPSPAVTVDAPGVVSGS